MVKVEAVANFKRPVQKKDVRSFLGLARYYRRLISNFSSIAAPLSDLTQIQGLYGLKSASEHLTSSKQL